MKLTEEYILTELKKFASTHKDYGLIITERNAERFAHDLVKNCYIPNVVCRLFHKIETIDNCHFVDKVDGRSVGKYKCTKCGRTYLANYKRSWYRCYV